VKAGFLAFHSLSLPWPDLEMHFTNHREGPFWELEPLVRDADYTSMWSTLDATEVHGRNCATSPNKLAALAPLLILEPRRGVYEPEGTRCEEADAQHESCRD
jgi:hypothetical protein